LIKNAPKLHKNISIDSLASIVSMESDIQKGMNVANNIQRKE
jgi:hypothetical protein